MMQPGRNLHAPGEARREIEAEYSRLAAAVDRRDPAAIRAAHAPGYTELQATGEERDLDEVMAEWAEDLCREPSLRIILDRVDVNADEATVVAHSILTQVDSLIPAMRLSIRVEMTLCDSWIKAEAGWQRAYSEQRVLKVWINHKLAEELRLEPPLTAKERAAVVRDLTRSALPFKTVIAGSGFDDLAALDHLVGDARIVALGEESHGSAEIFQMKHRIVEYLVEKKGFTVFAIEGNWPEAQVADHFIKTGEGSAAAALAAMDFWTWYTEEVSALIDWMRDRNAARGNRPALSFAGFDIQTAAEPIKRVIDFLSRTGVIDPDAVLPLYAGVEKLLPVLTSLPAAECALMRDHAAQALALIEAHCEALIAASTPQEYRDARQAARILGQLTRTRAGTVFAERDAAMAENVRWLMEEAFPGQKIVLWAHNGHVAAAPNGGEKTLGGHLRDCYGEQMVVIGFALHHGAIRAKRIAEGKFQPGPPTALPLCSAKPTSVEALFNETGLPRFILDLRRICEGDALGRWLAGTRPHRSIGAGHDPDRDNSYSHVRLRAEYDAIVFIAESSAAKPLREQAV